MSDVNTPYEPLRILLVEDDPEAIRTIWNMLHEKSTFRYEVEAVNGLPAAIARLEANQLDAVLLDLALVTERDEQDAVAAMRAADPAIAVLVLTELSREEAGLRALQGGAQDYLLKEEMGTRALVRALHYAAERNRTWRALRAHQARLQAIISSILDYAILSLDLQGRITQWSAGAERLFGYREAEILGQPVALLFTPQDQAAGAPERELATALSQGMAEDERWHVRRDGSQFFASGMLRPLGDASRTIHGYVKVARDSTERHRLEQDRALVLAQEQQARQAAQQSIELQRVFLGMISHELRTPLASIKGFASSLLATDVTFAAEDWRSFVQIIDEEADRLTDLIDQLLDVVRLQTRTLRILPAAARLEAIVEQALPQLATLTTQHALDVSLPANLPLVLADDKRIVQVLVNLVGNAAKFSPPGTPIRISAEADASAVQVFVSDEGVGIPVHEREAVFEVFHQVTREEQGNQGTGLGLAICKGLVEAHGGRIWIEDHPGPGTTAAFTLPIAREPSGA